MRSSPRIRTVRLLARTNPMLALALGTDVLLTASLPIAVVLSMGLLLHRMPAAFVGGLDSPAGDGVIQALVLVGASFFASMLLTPAHEALVSTIRVRMTYALQRELLDAVSGPIGIAHLEDPSTLDRVALAQGRLISFNPADAPGALAAVMAARLTWLVGCVVVGAFRWWLGVGLFLLWQLARPPIINMIKTHIQAFGGNAAVMRRADYFHQLSTKPAGAKELRVFGLGGWVVDRFRTNWAEGMAELWRVRAGITATIVKIGAVVLAFYLGACAVVAQAAIAGELSISGAAILLPVLSMAMVGGMVTFDDIALEWELSSLPQLDGLARDALAARGPSRGGISAATLPAQSIRFEGVRFRYPGQEHDVFAALDFEMPAGRSTALVGANGAGKTTLVKLLARLYDPTGGRIVVDDVDLREVDPVAWQRRVAVVFQDFAHLPLTAAENIAFGAPAHLDDHEGVVACAELAGIRQFVESLPAGWDTPLVRNLDGGVDASGGQWQRLALARALFAARHGASVLVFDEPTASLDVRGESEFFERFLELTAGLTTLVISHRFSTVRLVDQILVVEGGSVRESGSHDQLIAERGTYARLFRLQAARFVDDKVVDEAGEAP